MPKTVTVATPGGRKKYVITDAAARQLKGSALRSEDRLNFILRHVVNPSPELDAAINDWPHPFRIGEQVRLNSGGHRMTVVGLRCSAATCADPYAGELELVSVVWSQSSQLEGDDIAEMDFHPDVITNAMLLPHEEIPF